MPEKISTRMLIASVVAISILFSVLVYVYLGRKYLSIAGDFISYFVGAKVLSGGEGRLLYDLPTQFSFQTSVIGPEIADWVLPFRGVPVILLIYLPLTFLSLETAYMVFSVGNFLILIIFIYLLINTFKNVFKNAKHLFLLIVVFIPVLQTLWMGQLSILISLIFLLIYRNIKSEKYVVAGILTSLLLIKAQYLVALPFILTSVSKKKDFLVGFLPAFILLILLSSVISSPTWFLSYPSFLLATENSNYGSRFYDMESLYANARYLLPDVSGKLIMLLNAFLYVTVLFLFIRRSGKLTQDLLFVSTVLFSIVFSIHFLSFDYVLLLVPVYILFNILYENSRSKFGLVYILTFLIYAIPALAYVGLKPFLSYPILILGALFLFWDKNKVFRF